MLHANLSALFSLFGLFWECVKVSTVIAMTSIFSWLTVPTYLLGRSFSVPTSILVTFNGAPPTLSYWRGLRMLGAITPGFMIVTSMFYTREEQTRRVGYWCESSFPSSVVLLCSFPFLLRTERIASFPSPHERVRHHLPRLHQLRRYSHKCKSRRPHLRYPRVSFIVLTAFGRP